MTEDLQSKISRWLEQHGYPLEMRVAQLFASAGFEVTSSEYYIDPREGKAREIDVIATMSTQIQDVRFEMALVVECKSPRDAPWICFSSKTNATRDPKIGFLARICTREGKTLLTELSVNPDVTTRHLFELPARPAYGIVNAFKENTDVPYHALLGARAAAEALVAHYDELQAPPERIESICITFPVVVTTAPLFNASLNPAGHLDLQPTSHETVLRTGFDRYYSAVEVVPEPALQSFADARADLISGFLRRLPHRIPNTLQELGFANLASEE